MILFDARAQQHTHVTGVGMYTRHLALNILKTAIAPHIRFFQNAHASLHTPMPQKQTITTTIPNKILNTSIMLTRKPTLQSLARINESTPLFLPNIHFVATRSPYALTIHDLSFKHFPQWYAPKMRWWHKAVNADRLIKNAAHIICVSHATARDVQNTYNIESKRISVIYPGICTTHTSAHSQERPYILTIGSIEPRKNHTALLHAFARVIAKPQHKNLELKIVGPYGYRANNICALIKKLKIEKSVSMIGYADTSHKHALLAGARAFIYPSFFEGFGFPPLEAMTHGTPVITSWSSSLKEVCGHNALLINPYNYAELADAICALLEDEKLHKTLSEKGKQHAHTFTWNQCANKTAHVLSSML